MSDRAHLPAIRLQRAMQALFGTAPEPTSDYDLPALTAAARAHLLEHSNREFEKRVLGQKPGREKTPFSEAVGLAGHTQTDDPDRAQYVRLGRKYRTADYAEYLYVLVTFRHHEEEDAMARDLQIIAAILKVWMVDTDLDPERLGMLSRTHFGAAS